MRTPHSRRAARPALALAGVLALSGLFPNVALAHGPAAPVATSYLGRVTHAPVGVDAKVINGYLWLWLRVASSQSVVVLDYRGAPYVQFSRADIYVNENSEMYYLNQTLPEAPPAHLTRSTPAKWRHLSGEHEFAWHDGRIGALASSVVAPGASYLGTWSVAVLVNGHPGTISGGLWHAQNPSLVWFWPIVVLIACMLAAWRLRSATLDRRVTGVLAVVVLAAIFVGAAARWLYGRPGVPVEQVVLVVVLVAFASWAIARVLLGRAGFIQHMVTAGTALWIGLELLPTLLHGYVLTAGPPVMARIATVLCLGGCVALVPPSIRAALEEPEPVAAA
jgi:hypothetical protein